MDFLTYMKKLWEDIKSVGSSTNASKKAQKELEDYVRTYDSANQATVGQIYDRVAPDLLTDSEIEETARKEYDAWLAGKTEGVNTDYGIKTSEQELKKSALKDNYDYAAADIADSYLKASENSHNSSLRQGLARSSIDTGKSEAIIDAHDKSFERAQKNYLSNVEKIDLDISNLELKRRGALNDLDYQYAGLIDARIKTLKNERAKAQNEATAYNNSLTEKETAAAAQESAEKKATNIYYKADELLEQMSPAEARNYVRSNQNLKASLTPYYYYKLYKKYC